MLYNVNTYVYDKELTIIEYHRPWIMTEKVIRNIMYCEMKEMYSEIKFKKKKKMNLNEIINEN